ncbi:LLM class flavin-dependent oxidoreductase [Spongiactinospora sp. TRM90649]|uniref:LLM class flavin-dependent oxidoreductase n=1 Tax=Spongiactinospora sp. TRM90649 TaxID=3031114 RepID=UPI0023F9184F|nr:LLM class flavin-dependent oxidoreductase [Spongiactinospora sp. TRM90649]MDF5752241.1 LLM class flavin-dependent oxidoreductase [Spongiactinospora sp. TRM90649]
MLDHLSEGRLDVTVGSGHSPAEYRALGYSPKTRPSRMEEGLEVLKLAWTGEPFTHTGATATPRT